MRKWIVPGMLALILQACVDVPTDHVIEQPPPVQPSASWQASVAGLAASPGASGAVKVTEYGSYMVVDATVGGLSAVQDHQWRLFFGTCNERIAAFGPNANPPAYPPIRPDPSGSGGAVATVMGRLRADSAYHVLFFVPVAGPPVDTVWHACGQLTRG